MNCTLNVSQKVRNCVTPPFNKRGVGLGKFVRAASVSEVPLMFQSFPEVVVDSLNIIQVMKEE